MKALLYLSTFGYNYGMTPPKRGPQIVHGDSLEIMKMLPDDSVDSIVTDPPYGLGFMGKAWDALPPGLEWAEECLRVLKPGGHLLAFGGTRTWHRLAVAVEDAGFEIRDSIFWLYGSGFPKHRAALKPACEPVVMARKPFKGSLTGNEAEHRTGALNIDACRVKGSAVRSPLKADGTSGNRSSRHEGWQRPWNNDPEAVAASDKHARETLEKARELGRWPANVVLDETTAPLLDRQSGNRPGATTNSAPPTSKGFARGGKGQGKAAGYADNGGASRFFKVAKADEYGAISEHFPREFDAPFMYVAKAPKRERPVVDGVAHPTVKPLALMRWLVKLVTPPGGTVLEPFAGSGATVEACILEGFHCIAIEREAEYLPLIQARIDRQDAA